MTRDEAQISDELLTGYLDGELDAAQMTRITQALAQDGALAARLEALDVLDDRFHADMGTLLSQAPAMPATRSGGWAPLPLAAALAGGLLIGAGLMTALRPTETAPRGWQDYAAAYHLLYRTETLSTVDAPSDLAGLSTVIGRDLAPAPEIAGLSFVRAQLLGYGDAPLIQMAYLSEDGVPYALCIMAAQGPAQAPMARQIEGLPTAYWSDGTHEYLLIGGEGAESVIDLAEGLQTRL